MDQSSDYKYFRYLMALNYATGHFTADKVFSPNLEDLQFKIARIPVCMYIILSTSCTWMAMNFILYDFNGELLIIVHHLVFFCMDMAFTLWNLFVGSKSVIDVFKILAAFRKKQADIPDVLKVAQSSPAAYAYTMTVLFLITHTVIPTAYMYYLDLDLKWTWVCYFAHFTCSPYRVCLIFSSLFHLSGLIVQDTARAWSRCCERYGQSFYHIEVFCQLLQEQRDMVDKINLNLGTPILILLVYRCATVASNLLYDTHFKDPVITNVSILVLWTFFLGLWMRSFKTISVQYKKLSQDIFVMAARGMSHRDACRARLLLDQVHENPGEFSAAGFVQLNAQLFIYFLTLGVDFAIMLYQNLALLKRLLSSPGTSALSQNATLLQMEVFEDIMVVAN